MRNMRRSRQQLSDAETIQIFKEGTGGVLSLYDPEGYPYGVPMSYVYDESGVFYFHCAKEGHKIDAIKNCDKASFCVIAQDQVIPEKMTTYYRSAIAFGAIRILSEEEKLAAIWKLARKYSPGRDEAIQAEIDHDFERLCMLELKAERMTGKEAIELVRAKEA